MRRFFDGLPTGAKLFLLMTLALLPLGLATAWNTSRSMALSRDSELQAAGDRAELAARAIDSLIARNALALRIAANTPAAAGADGCAAVSQAMAIAPGISRPVVLTDREGRIRCAPSGLMVDRDAAEEGGLGDAQALAVGGIALELGDGGLRLRVGVPTGEAIEIISAKELSAAALSASPDITSLTLAAGDDRLQLLGAEDRPPEHGSRIAIGNGRLTAQVGTHLSSGTIQQRLQLGLPLLMWLIAALVGWLLVNGLLTQPLRRLQEAVSRFEPGDRAFELPDRIGMAEEIRELGLAFGRTIERIDRAEQEMGQALEGQRRLVREVHHRVKNNLQVVASLLSIHSRTASTPEAREAYAGIMRRVDALSVVHRYHFAEVEENRGVALRPLLSELAAGLRAGAPEAARGMVIELDLSHANTTQDVAVAVAFLVTEIVEFTMIRCPGKAVDIVLRRIDELTSELAIASNCLIMREEEQSDPERQMFERVVDGLARQLRSPLERRTARYSVTIPTFPEK